MSQLISTFSCFQGCFLISAQRDSVHRRMVFRNLGPFLLIFAMCRNRICTCKTQYKTHFFCFVFWLTQKRQKTEGLSFMHRHRGKSLFYVHARNGGPFSTVFYSSKCTSDKSQKTQKNRGVVFNQQSIVFGHFLAGSAIAMWKCRSRLHETSTFTKNINFT